MNRLTLRAKLALVALVLLALPWAGYRYVREMERFLLGAQEAALAATARAVATALHDRPQLLAYRSADESELRREAERELRRLAGGTSLLGASETADGGLVANAEIAAILKGVARASSRVWVVSRDYRVLALAGSLRRPEPEPPGFVQGALGWLIGAPTEDFDEAIADEALGAGREIASALQGAAGERTRNTRDGRARIVSAAHPIWVGDQVYGAVVVEETTNRIASFTSQALERLLTVTLAVFALVGAVLLWFATRISSRIRKLRDEAEAAIDAHGRVTRLLTASGTGDEIGDLSRSFTTVLRRMSRYNAYLEGMAGRLSHELRTPIAVVRSSLENLHAARGDEEARTYLARAEEGLGRLSAILARMAEASRLEQGLSTEARERYDAVPVVRGCAEGYRLAYARTAFEVAVPSVPVMLDGSADLLAQMLDKLVENAVDFQAPGTSVRIVLGADASLRVENAGPPLPEAIRESLFESMVSQRAVRSGDAPHLGLGLYVARLIAEFHGGSLRAENLPGGRGVAVTANLRVAREPTL
ncbi:MAG: HAMP domain-containing protein [Betaproteobacteria bacterium]|nr:MAG: HAMP domain-containing protein [Betaproteobacteria bacterium]